MSEVQNKHLEFLQVQDEIRRLQERAAQLKAEGRQQALADIVGLIALYEFGPAELGFPAAPAGPKRDRKPEKRRDRTPKGDPKYRDPESGATWTGTGRTPNWIAGQDWDAFLIDKRTADEKWPVNPAIVQGVQALTASQAVHQMVSGTPAQPAAAWPGGAPGFPQPK